MNEIIERLEKATGPDRQLGNDVLLACGWRLEEEGDGPDRRLFWSSPDADYNDGDQPDPTASLDAARLLVSGFFWLAGEGKTRAGEPLGGAQIFRTTYLVKPIAEAEHDKVEIALCIAVLKAREAPHSSQHRADNSDDAAQ